MLATGTLPFRHLGVIAECCFTTLAAASALNFCQIRISQPLHPHLTVRQEKEDGGLGIKRLDTQNACLLLKLIHRLHHPQGSAWAAWVRDQTNLDTLQGSLTGTHWGALAYQKISRVNLGNGRNTSFWNDIWLGDKPLSEHLPILYSHFASLKTPVQAVLSTPLRPLFQPRLSPQTNEELQMLQTMLHNVALSEGEDDRTCFFADSNRKLITGLIYRTSMREDTNWPFISVCLGEFCHHPTQHPPPKGKNFWLAHHQEQN